MNFGTDRTHRTCVEQFGFSWAEIEQCANGVVSERQQLGFEQITGESPLSFWRFHIRHSRFFNLYSSCFASVQLGSNRCLQRKDRRILTHRTCTSTQRNHLQLHQQLKLSLQCLKRLTESSLIVIKNKFDDLKIKNCCVLDKRDLQLKSYHCWYFFSTRPDLKFVQIETEDWNQSP